MNKPTAAPSNDMGQLVEDAQALMVATADMAGEKVRDARKGLAVALERAKEIAERVRYKARQGHESCQRNRATIFLGPPSYSELSRMGSRSSLNDNRH